VPSIHQHFYHLLFFHIIIQFIIPLPHNCHHSMEVVEAVVVAAAVVVVATSAVAVDYCSCDYLDCWSLCYCYLSCS
jgi:hypothetical protein